MANKYQALLGKLRAATGPFPEREASDLAERMYPGDGEDEKYWLLFLALQSGHQATGAALELVEMELPGHKISMTNARRHDAWVVALWKPFVLRVDPNYGLRHAPTLPLAILIAWCEAMIAKEASNGD